MKKQTLSDKILGNYVSIGDIIDATKRLKREIKIEFHLNFDKRINEVFGNKLT